MCGLSRRSRAAASHGLSARGMDGGSSVVTRVLRRRPVRDYALMTVGLLIKIIAWAVFLLAVRFYWPLLGMGLR